MRTPQQFLRSWPVLVPVTVTGLLAAAFIASGARSIVLTGVFAVLAGSYVLRRHARERLVYQRASATTTPTARATAPSPSAYTSTAGQERTR